MAETGGKFTTTPLFAVRLALDLIEPIAGKKVLDVGTGDGRFACEAAARGALVTALDTDVDTLWLAGQRTRRYTPAYFNGICQDALKADYEPYDALVWSLHIGEKYGEFLAHVFPGKPILTVGYAFPGAKIVKQASATEGNVAGMSLMLDYDDDMDFLDSLTVKDVRTHFNSQYSTGYRKPRTLTVYLQEFS